jgi:tripartite-type tricarboxylate transporter receptor subunit TctC
MRVLHLLIGTFALLVTALSPAHAESWPTRPIKIVVGFAAGGANDLQARIIAQTLTERLGQPVIVENKPGAGGNMAAEFVASAAPDGHTLLLAPTSTLVLNAAVYSKLPYDPLQSFTHVIQVSRFPLHLAINASHPAKSVKDLIGYAKANPHKANYGSTAIIFQLVTEFFNAQAGTQFVRVPFKSGAEMVTALLSGQVTMVFNEPAAMMSHVATGSLRLLATTGRTRADEFPQVPTMAEVGFPGIEFEALGGIVGPKNLPATVVKRLHAEIDTALITAEVRERFHSLGISPAGGTSQDFSAMLAREIPRWKGIAKAANIRLD